ncbi:uncharacterized protein NPIL_344991, partial [Nephila pilipes]
EETLVEILIQT